MTEPYLLKSLRDGVLTITMNRPEGGNRIDRAMMQALHDAIEAADADTSVRVIVLTGAGEYFCAGGRVDGYPTGTLRQRMDYAQAFCSMHERMGRAAAPIVAAVSGHCTAGGMSLLSFCDVAVAAEDVEFGYPEATHGLFPALALGIMIPILPPKRAFDMLFTGKLFSAAEALRLELVNKVVPRAKVMTEVGAYVDAIKRLNQTSVTLGRRAYYAMVPMTPASRLQYAQTFLATMLSSEGAGPAPAR
jgi:enoyl-CoA hydratase/carnithine racemase